MSQDLMKERIADYDKLADSEWKLADAAMDAGDFVTCDRHRSAAEGYQSKANRLKQFIVGAEKEGVGDPGLQV